MKYSEYKANIVMEVSEPISANRLCISPFRRIPIMPHTNATMEKIGG